MSLNENKQNEFLDIPYSEHIIPFPNFASVIMQHAREFPDKIALQFSNKKMTYKELLNTCLSMEFKKDIEYDPGLQNIEDDLIRLLALLIQGIPFNLNFPRPGTYICEKEMFREISIDFFDPPYVKLDDKAFNLNGKYEFSQYNVLVAAQAVGNAFKLFREGAAYCHPDMLTISDLIFGVIAPLYFAKSIYFIEIDEADFFQYSWKGQITSNLRDTAMVSDEVNYNENSYHLMESFEQALGLGKVISPEGKVVAFLGLEIIDGEPRGHCLAKK